MASNEKAPVSTSWDNDSSEDEEMQEEEKVQVKFITRLEDPRWQAPDTAYYVPLSLARYGLSEVLNNLLALEEPQAFDILVDDHFLRTSLHKYLKARGLAHDDVVLELEYILALEAPQEKSAMEHEDWIACVVSARSPAAFCCSGGYDGTVRFWSPEESDPYQFECAAILPAHAKPIKAIQLLASDAKKTQILTASQDFTIKWWQIRKVHKSASLLAARKDTLLGEFAVHQAPIESVSVSPNEDKFLSGDFDGVIYGWDFDEFSAAGDDDQDDEGRHSKRQKTEPKRKPVVKMTEHAGCVAALEWKEEAVCWSGGWDHSLRAWDLPSGICTRKMFGGTPIYSLSCHPQAPTLLTGHADRTIRLWDPRSKGQLVVGQFKSHKAWVPSVQWHPTREHIFASASHDGTVKIWDKRSEFALHSIAAHDQKALCVGWHSDGIFLSGGADTKLKVHQFTLP